MKFKVGDKIKVKNDLDKIKDFKCTYMPDMKNMEGKIATISWVSGDGTYAEIEECPHKYNYDVRAFEKIYEKITLEELKNMPIGTKITIDRKDDNVFVKVEEDELEFYSLEENENIDHWDINDNLTLDDFEGATKIIKIERPIEYDTIYECLEEEKKTMTIAEIEKELGYSIKIVKEAE